jgi:hypothetical protein
VEEVSCTEAWLRMNVEEPTEGASFQLLRGDSAIYRGILTGADTSFYDDGLLPARQYVYRAQLLKAGRPVAQSPPLTVQTMDTTSHDFSWELIEIPSSYGSGALYDIALVSEFEAWAVGEIYADSTQPWLPYNAVHWDGQQWELKRITVKLNYGGGNVISTDADPIKTIYRSSDGNVWFVSMAGGVTVYDGADWNYLIIPYGKGPGGANAVWGTSSSDLYFVGMNGNITRYDGQSWQKLESGTDLRINDIWGAKNEKTGEWEILCVAARLDRNEGSALLKIDGDGVEKLQTEGLSWSLKAVWFIPGVIYYIGGDGLYPSRNLTARWHTIPSPFLYKHAIRGQAVNDVIVAGSFGLLSHFNGVSWLHYNGGHFPSTSAAYRGVAIHNDIIVAVGYYNLRNGIVAVGRRN